MFSFDTYSRQLGVNGYFGYFILLLVEGKLKTYTGECINVLGAITVDVTCNGQQARLNLLVVAGNRPSLMGRDLAADHQAGMGTPPTGLFNIQAAGCLGCTLAGV